MFSPRHAPVEIILLRPQRVEEMERAVHLLQAHATIVVDLEDFLRVRALIKLPVNTVITTAVFFGRNLNRLKRALPILLPKRSPRVERTPPSTSTAKISSQPVTAERQQQGSVSPRLIAPPAAAVS